MYERERHIKGMRPRLATVQNNHIRRHNRIHKNIHLLEMSRRVHSKISKSRSETAACSCDVNESVTLHTYTSLLYCTTTYIKLYKRRKPITEVDNMENEIKYIEQRSQAIAKHINKLRQSIKDIDTEMTPFFTDAGIRVADDKFKYADGGNTYELAIMEAIYGKYAGQWGVYLSNNQDVIWIGDAPRAALKQAVPRIIPMLEKYSRVLAQNELEFKEIAETVETMADSIRKVCK